MTEVEVIARTPRPTGTPARCAACGAICSPAMLGPSYCPAHGPRLQGSDEATRRAMFDRARAANAAPGGTPRPRKQPKPCRVCGTPTTGLVCNTPVCDAHAGTWNRLNNAGINPARLLAEKGRAGGYRDRVLARLSAKGLA